MAHCLVTGGAGFIGSHLCEFLLNCNQEVVAIIMQKYVGFSKAPDVHNRDHNFIGAKLKMLWMFFGSVHLYSEIASDWIHSRRISLYNRNRPTNSKKFQSHPKNSKTHRIDSIYIGFPIGFPLILVNSHWCWSHFGAILVGQNIFSCWKAKLRSRQSSNWL